LDLKRIGGGSYLFIGGRVIRLSAEVCIDAPVAQVWKVLSDLEGIVRWVPAIRRAHCPGAQRGLGASRVCELSQATIVETIEAWDEGKSFVYRGEGAPMMRGARNHWAVEARGEQTVVTTHAEVSLAGGWLGRLLEPLARWFFGRLGRQTLASLKFLVENGQPPPRRLAPVPAQAGC
jgi:carbon monoxide dehydrogenase subunit G